MFDFKVIVSFEIVKCPVLGREVVRFLRFMRVDALLGHNLKCLALS